MRMIKIKKKKRSHKRSKLIRMKKTRTVEMKNLKDFMEEMITESDRATLSQQKAVMRKTQKRMKPQKERKSFNWLLKRESKLNLLNQSKQQLSQVHKSKKKRIKLVL